MGLGIRREAQCSKSKGSQRQVRIDSETSVVGEEGHPREERPANAHEEISDREASCPDWPETDRRDAKPEKTARYSYIDCENGKVGRCQMGNIRDAQHVSSKCSAEVNGCAYSLGSTPFDECQTAYR
jgi:hypothetical protein